LNKLFFFFFFQQQILKYQIGGTKAFSLIYYYRWTFWDLLNCLWIAQFWNNLSSLKHFHTNFFYRRIKDFSKLLDFVITTKYFKDLKSSLIKIFLFVTLRIKLLYIRWFSQPLYCFSWDLAIWWKKCYLIYTHCLHLYALQECITYIIFSQKSQHLLAIIFQMIHNK
jgi:hypothetical protein